MQLFISDYTTLRCHYFPIPTTITSKNLSSHFLGGKPRYIAQVCLHHTSVTNVSTDSISPFSYDIERTYIDLRNPQYWSKQDK